MFSLKIKTFLIRFWTLWTYELCLPVFSTYCPPLGIKPQKNKPYSLSIILYFIHFFLSHDLYWCKEIKKIFFYMLFWPLRIYNGILCLWLFLSGCGCLIKYKCKRLLCIFRYFFFHLKHFYVTVVLRKVF